MEILNAFTIFAIIWIRFLTVLFLTGGEGGIRTHGTLTSTQTFQVCRIGHSRTSPEFYSIVAYKNER